MMQLNNYYYVKPNNGNVKRHNNLSVGKIISALYRNIVLSIQSQCIDSIINSNCLFISLSDDYFQELMGNFYFMEKNNSAINKENAYDF